MSNQVISQLVKIANDKRPELFNALRSYKQAEEKGMMGKAMDSVKDFGNTSLAAGKDYAPSIGYGAAGGAIAGIPIALLANALMGKDKSLRGSLRSALMGSLIGGGVGAAGGATAKALHNNGFGAKMDSGLDTAGDFIDDYGGHGAGNTSADFLKRVLGGSFK
jgi:hypothetical protein